MKKKQFFSAIKTPMWIFSVSVSLTCFFTSFFKHVGLNEIFQACAGVLIPTIFLLGMNIQKWKSHNRRNEIKELVKYIIHNNIARDEHKVNFYTDAIIDIFNDGIK